MRTPADGDRGAPTLESVAALAHVSRATASRVLRGDPKVSEATRTAVLTAARDLSYTPNLAARSLVTGRSDAIGFFVDEPQDSPFRDLLVPNLLRTVQLSVVEAGSQLVFSTGWSREEHGRFLRYAGRHVDGVVLASRRGDEALPRALENLGVPTVLAGRPRTGEHGLYYVAVDDRGGARLATLHLVRSGRRLVATIAGPQRVSAGEDRLQGYVQGLTESDVAIRTDLIAGGDFTVAGGYDAMNRLLAVEPDVDAVFAASDLMAIGAMRAIERSGRQVPEDVAVVGFDDISEAATAPHELTTVRQPVTEVGQAMARVLMSRIAGREAPRATVLPVSLVPRATA